MRPLPTLLIDPSYQHPVTHTRYEKFWLRYINDPRDLPFVHLLTAIHVLVIPVAILLYTPLLQGTFWWITYGLYFYISQLYFKGRFGLMLHCICHRKLFKKEASFLQHWVIWMVCPFFGHTPETYFAHHMGMHHVENNMEDDASSTLRYQRDSLLGFGQYVLRFLLLGFRDTFLYFFSRNRKKFYLRLTAGELTFYLFCLLMAWHNWFVTLLVFILPFVFARVVMMLGNWAQHAFVNPDNPEENTINCINTAYNKTCWNDGYHFIHHERPALHYTDIPAEFLKRKSEIAQRKILTFEGIHYLHIFCWLMTKRYDKLASHLVNIDNMFSSEEEAMAILKQRTQRFL